MGFQIEKSTILPHQPDSSNAEGLGRFNVEIVKYLDEFQKLLNKDLQGLSEIVINGEQRTRVRSFYTGTLDADSETTFAHGLIASKIVNVSAIFTDGTNYYTSSSRLSVSSTLGFDIQFNVTNIVLTNMGTNLQGNTYIVCVESYDGDAI